MMQQLTAYSSQLAAKSKETSKASQMRSKVFVFLAASRWLETRRQWKYRQT